MSNKRVKLEFQVEEWKPDPSNPFLSYDKWIKKQTKKYDEKLEHLAERNTPDDVLFEMDKKFTLAVKENVYKHLTIGQAVTFGDSKKGVFLGVSPLGVKEVTFAEDEQTNPSVSGLNGAMYPLLVFKYEDSDEQFVLEDEVKDVKFTSSSMMSLTPKTFIVFKQEDTIDDLTEDDIKDLFKDRPLTQDTINVFGPKIIPRFQKFYSLDGSTYKYSGKTLIPQTENIPNLVLKCLNYAKTNYPPETKWNGALVNWYMDGKQHIGWHSDDERDLDPESPILSFSFGTTRKFQLKHKTDPTNSHTFQLKNNSLIVMGGDCQKEFKHRVPPNKKIKNPRINITIRALKSKKVSQI